MTIQVNAYSTIANEIPLDFPHQLDAKRDHSDAELMDHLRGFLGFIMQGGQREMTSSLYAMMRHIERVRYQYSFCIEQEDLDSMADWGWLSNSIFYLPDGSVRDPAGAVLVDPESGLPADGCWNWVAESSESTQQKWIPGSQNTQNSGTSVLVRATYREKTIAVRSGC